MRCFRFSWYWKTAYLGPKARHLQLKVDQLLEHHTPGILLESEIRLQLGSSGTFYRDVVPLVGLCTPAPTLIKSGWFYITKKIIDRCLNQWKGLKTSCIEMFTRVLAVNMKTAKEPLKIFVRSAEYRKSDNVKKLSVVTRILAKSTRIPNKPWRRWRSSTWQRCDLHFSNFKLLTAANLSHIIFAAIVVLFRNESYDSVKSTLKIITPLHADWQYLWHLNVEPKAFFYAIAYVIIHRKQKSISTVLSLGVYLPVSFWGSHLLKRKIRERFGGYRMTRCNWVDSNSWAFIHHNWERKPKTKEILALISHYLISYVSSFGPVTVSCSMIWYPFGPPWDRRGHVAGVHAPRFRYKPCELLNAMIPWRNLLFPQQPSCLWTKFCPLPWKFDSFTITLPNSKAIHVIGHSPLCGLVIRILSNSYVTLKLPQACHQENQLYPAFRPLLLSYE